MTIQTDGTTARRNARRSKEILRVSDSVLIRKAPDVI